MGLVRRVISVEYTEEDIAFIEGTSEGTSEVVQEELPVDVVVATHTSTVTDVGGPILMRSGYRFNRLLLQ